MIYQYTAENELVVEALSHQVVDVALSRLSKLEQNLESFCEVAPISQQKLKILKEFKRSKFFEIEPKWLSQLLIIRKKNVEAVVFHGKTSQTLARQRKYFQCIEQLDDTVISGLSSVQIDILTAHCSNSQKTQLEMVLERNRCMLVGNLPTVENRSYRFYALNAEQSESFLSDLKFSISKSLPAGSLGIKKWTNIISFNDQLKFHHNLRFFTKLKETQITELEVHSSDLQIQLQLPMESVTEAIRTKIANPPNIEYKQLIQFEPLQRQALVASKSLEILMGSNKYVACQFAEQNISLRSFSEQDLEDIKAKIVHFKTYQIKLPFKDRTFNSEQVQRLRRLIPLQSELKEKWDDLNCLDSLDEITICEEQQLRSAPVYYIQLEATINHYRKTINRLRNLLNSLIFIPHQVTPLTAELLKLKKEEGSTALDQFMSFKQVYSHRINPLSFELIIRQEENYEIERQQCIQGLTNLQSRIGCRFEQVRPSLMRKLGVLLEFSRIPRYIAEMNCVLDKENKGFKIYSLRPNDQQLFLEYLKIVSESLGAVFPFQVQTNISLLVEQKLNYTNLKRDYNCQVKSWLHLQNLQHSSLYVHAKGAHPKGYQQIEQGVKAKIKEQQNNRELAILVFPYKLIEELRTREFNKELISDITQVTQKYLPKPQWLVRQLSSTLENEEQNELTQSLIWKYSKDAKIPDEIHELIETTFQNGVVELNKMVSIFDKEYELTLTFNSKTENTLQIGIKRYALKRVQEVCEFCFFKRHLQNVALSAVGFIKFIKIKWELIKEKELAEFLEELTFTDLTYLQQEQGIVFNPLKKQVHYLSLKGSQAEEQQVLHKLVELQAMKNNMPPQYEMFYQFKRKKYLIKLPVQHGSPQFQYFQKFVPPMNQFTIHRIQNVSAYFQLMKYMDHKQTIKLEVFQRGEYRPPKANELIPLQDKLAQPRQGVHSTRPSTTIHEINSEESKTQKLEGKYVMYWLYYTSKKEEILDYSEDVMETSFFDSHFLTHDLVCVRDMRQDVYFVPKERSQLLPIYEITF